MKYIYVLVSSIKDLYYEQALMSVFSLKHHTPQAKIIILVDDRTKESFVGCRDELAKLAEIISIPFDKSVSNVERSRLIKTSIPNYVQGDFLYIDCDTIICDDLSDIEDTCKYPMELGGVLDGHVMLPEHIHKDYFLKRDKKLGFSGTKAANCNFNGGLVLARDTELVKDFFRQWNEIWKYSAYKKHDFHDQSALNEANYKTGLKMQQMPGEWNCQPSHGGLAFLKDAKIIHYYSSEFSGKNYVPYYKLGDPAIQRKIQESGTIPEEIKNMILDPKFQFNKVHLVNDSRIVSIMQSPLLFTLSDMQTHTPWLFNFFEMIVSGTRSFVKKILHK